MQCEAPVPDVELRWRDFGHHLDRSQPSATPHTQTVDNPATRATTYIAKYAQTSLGAVHRAQRAFFHDFVDFSDLMNSWFGSDRTPLARMSAQAVAIDAMDRVTDNKDRGSAIFIICNGRVCENESAAALGRPTDSPWPVALQSGL
jgi:hypothetical protein